MEFWTSFPHPLNSVLAFCWSASHCGPFLNPCAKNQWQAVPCVPQRSCGSCMKPAWCLQLKPSGATRRHGRVNQTHRWHGAGAICNGVLFHQQSERLLCQTFMGFQSLCRAASMFQPPGVRGECFTRSTSCFTEKAWHCGVHGPSLGFWWQQLVNTTQNAGGVWQFRASFQ